MAKHAKICGPSSAHRWMTCPGSERLSQGMPDSSSKYAEEGSLAHKLGEACLLSGLDPLDYVGLELADETAAIAEEMAAAVKVYTDYVKDLSGGDCEPGNGVWKLFGHNLSAVELPIDLGWLIPGGKGTTDFVLYRLDTGDLHVVDYKHGAGVAVDPEWNPQLLLYAAGVVHDLRERGHTGFSGKVFLHIVQPRAGRR